MNAIFRIVWSAARNAFIVAHEYANSAGRPAAARKRTAAALVLGLASSLAWASDPAPGALPTGGQITAGSGSISQSGANMTVQQNTDKLITNWQSFNIGSQASVTFNQPSSSSVALNRVLGQDPSQILGHLNANGQVMLVNPAGVVFGQGSQINVGGITATTLNISDADFLANHYHFADSANAATVENLGHILANGGVVALVAPVVQNEGTIETPNGSAALAAGNDVTLDFSGDGLVTVTVSQSRLDNLVENKGAIRADNGLVILTAGAASDLLAGAVNNSGIVEATGLSRQGGRIILDGGAVTNDGTLDVSSGAASGGEVTVTGHDILLTGNSRIDASGATGGGQVLVGGDWQGSGSLHQATTVTMEQGATIDVSATKVGSGGTAVLWSDLNNPDSVTKVDGAILARGGADDGNGGRIETSGSHASMGDMFSVDASAPKGETGLWLIDPHDFTVANSKTGTITSGTPSGDITPLTLQQALSTSNVTILSSQGSNANGSGDINFIGAQLSVYHTLTLTAARNINFLADASNGNSMTFLQFGTNGQLVMNAGTTNGSDTAVAGGRVNFQILPNGTAGGSVQFMAAATNNALTINGNSYTIIKSLGVAADATGGTNQTLQGLARTANLGTSGSPTYFALGLSIDASSTSTDTTNFPYKFQPIGDAATSTYYRGVFEGLGNTITGLTVSSAYTAGMFGQIANASISNVILQNPNITSFGGAGALVGFGLGTNTITNTAAVSSGTMVTGGSGGVGGLAGYFSGSITDSFSTGDVSSAIATGSGANLSGIGGLVGALSSGSITSSFATGAVNGDGSTAGTTYTVTGLGGLVGVASGSISYSYATGAVTSTGGTGPKSDFGGLVGSLSSGQTIADSYARGAVSGQANVGGLVGNNAGTIARSYATGTVSGTTTVGALVGAKGTVTDGYYDSSINGAMTGAGGADQTGITGMPTANMKVSSNYTNWDFSAVWGIKSTINNGYPALRAINGSSAFTTAVTINVNALSKTYGDANPSLGGQYSLSGCTGCITLDWGGFLTTSTAAGSYAYSSTSNLLSLTYVSGSASDYSLSWGGTSFTVNPKVVTLSGTKTYDGSATTSGTTFTVGGTVNGDTVTVSGGSGTLASKDAGNQAISSMGTLALSSGNYTLTGGSGSVTIDPRLLTLTATKTYDGSTALSSVTLGNLVSGETLTYSGATASSKDAATANNYVDAITLGNGTGGGVTTNYSLPSLTAYSANNGVTINKAMLTVTGNKVYDGSTNLFGNLTLGGFVGSETVDYSAATASSSHVATANKYVSSITLTDGTNGGLASNYQIPASYGAGTNAVTINAVTLTPTISNTGVTKVYDGSTSTAITPTYNFSGFISGDTAATLTNTGESYNSKDVATANTITVSGLAISGITGTNGSLATDYALDSTSKTVAATITPKDVSVSSIQVADKVYDGTTNATSVQSTVLSGVIAADSANVNTTGTLSAFGGKDVGTYSVSVTGMSLTGSAAGNYNLTSSTATDSSVAITRKTVTLSAAKTYDGTTDLTGDVTLGGFIGSETLSYTGATASDSHVATVGKYIGAITLADGSNGGLASNYQLPTLNAANAPVAINAATLTPTISNTGVTKVYDGGTSTTLTPTYTFAGLVSGDTGATLTNSGESYNSKDVATANTITVSGLAISGITGSNGSQATDYALDSTSKTVAATITARTLNVTYTGVDKVYDGTANATVATSDDRVAGDLLTVSDTASFGNKNVGTGKTISVAGASLSGTDAGNYVLASTAGSATAKITARTLHVTYTGVDKIYDGTANATVATADDRIAGDLLTVSDTASFGNKNVGTGKTISVAGASLSGTDAGNYVLTSTAGSTMADITPKSLSLSGLTAENKDYDGNTNATISSYGSLSGLISGDVVSMDTSGAVARFADPNPGIGKTVTVANLQLAGLDSGNYLLGTQTTTANINSTVPPPQVPTSSPSGNGGGIPGTNTGGDPFTPPPLVDGGNVPQVPPVVDGSTQSTVSTSPNNNDATGGGSGSGNGTTPANPNGGTTSQSATTNPDGSTSTSTTVTNPNGGSTTTTRGSDGSTSTTITTPNPNGGTTSQSTTTYPDGGSTTTTTVTHPGGDSTTTTKGSDGSSSTSTTVPNQSGGKTTETIVTGPDGGSTTSTTVTKPDGDSTTTTKTPDGSSTTTQTGGGGLSVNVTYPDGTSAKTTYPAEGGSMTQVVNADGSRASVMVSPDGKEATTTMTSKDGRTTSKTQNVDKLPLEQVVVKLSLAQIELSHKDGFLLLDRLHGADPKVVAIAMVSGEGGLPLPVGLRYDATTGRMYVAGSSGWPPFYVVAVDRNGDAKRFKVQLRRVKKEQGR